MKPFQGIQGLAKRNKSTKKYYYETKKIRQKRQKHQIHFDIIGKKREYIALLEKGETDMQLSTFLMITDAVGLNFGLVR